MDNDSKARAKTNAIADASVRRRSTSINPSRSTGQFFFVIEADDPEAKSKVWQPGRLPKGWPLSLL